MRIKQHKVAWIPAVARMTASEMLVGMVWFEAPKRVKEEAQGPGHKA